MSFVEIAKRETSEYEKKVERGEKVPFEEFMRIYKFKRRLEDGQFAFIDMLDGKRG